MAVRFDNDGESYTRAVGLGSVSVWSFACWVNLAVDRAATTALLQIDNGSGTSKLRINAWNGVALTHQTDAGGWFGNIGHSLVVGTWSFVGISGTANPGQVRTAARSAGSTTWAGGQSSQTNVTFNATTLRIGAGQAANEWLNGSMAAVKVWDQALSVEELRYESWTYLPRRTAGLRGWYPFLTPTTTDMSGAGQTLSGGSGAVLADGPPIQWSSGRRRIVRFTGITQAEIAATLPALTGSASGTVVVSGLQSAVLPALTGDLDAAAAVEGQAAAVLPPLTAAASSEVGAPGLLTAVLPALTGAFDGLLTGGFLTAQLPALTGSAQGQLAAQGVMSAVLPPLTGSLSGEAEIPHNNLDITVGPPYRGWAARPLPPSWAVDATAARWQAGSPAITWTPARPARGWKARQPTT